MQNEWIEVEEELPEEDDVYLVLWESDLFKQKFIALCDFYKDEGFVLKSIQHIKGHMNYNAKVTHWMPTPEILPKEDK